MHLPSAPNLPIKNLSACFNNTSATYKFYWLLAIIQEIEAGEINIPKRALFSRMISNAWYTVNYFHVSFGKQDLIQQSIQSVKILEHLDMSQNATMVYNTLLNSRKHETISIIKHFNNNVPHWFLSPWYPGYSRSDIYEASKKSENKPLYALNLSDIEIYQSFFNLKIQTFRTSLVNLSSREKDPD
jgi:hypothetical protein